MIGYLALIGLVASHMDMVSPPPRRSPKNKAYSGNQIDYDMTSPLGEQFPYPCRGYGPGPVSGTYEAGSSIPVQLSGGANHNGGHCQFSLSYDDVNFASIKTIMGTCMVDTLSYQVKIPEDAPGGKVTLAWSWINRTGNREYYMNCADIEIKGSPGGSPGGKVVGSKMLVADLPGYITFPEGFGNNYGEDIFAKQPTITVAPATQITPTNAYPSVISSPTPSSVPSSTYSTSAPASTSTPAPHPPRCRPRK